MTSPRLRVLAGLTIAAGCLTVAAIVAEELGPGAGAGWWANVSWTTAGVCALAGALAAAVAQPPGSRVRGAWLLFAAGSGCWLVGAIIRDVQGTGLLSVPVTVAWTGFAVVCMAALAHRLPRLSVFGVFLLDTIPVALLIVALARAATQVPTRDGLDYRLFLRVFPGLYVLLAVHSLQMTGLRRAVRRLPASIYLFTFGFGLMALGALFWVPGELAGARPQSLWSAPLWSLGLLALAAAGLTRAFHDSRVLRLPPAEQQSGLGALPPGVAVLVMIILLPFTRPQDRLALQAFLLVSAVALSARIYLMRRQDLRLFAELVRSRHAAEQAAARASRSAQRLRQLADVTLRLKSLVLDELVQAVCDTAREVVGARCAAFGLASGPDVAVDRLVTSGLDEAARSEMVTAVGQEGGPLGAMLRAGAPVTASTFSGSPDNSGLPPGHPFAGSVLSVPVPLDSTQRGALYLAGKEGGFDGDDETVAALLATNAGHAIANAQLYSESRAQQEQLAFQNEQLRDLDRLKDEFVALVSHELRTPLTSIIGYLELIKDEESAALTIDQRAFTDVIHRNARRLLRLVGDLLFLSRVQSGTLSLVFGETDLTEVIEHAIEETQLAASAKHITLTLATRPLPPLRADGTRLAQLAANLLSNAVKFTPEDGRVAVTVKLDGGSAVLMITDTGIGISADDQRHVFERFYRAPSVADRAFQGTGLGLTISKAIAEAHDGSISVQSHPGQGTTVMVRIPLGPASKRSVPDQGRAHGVPAENAAAGQPG